MGQSFKLDSPNLKNPSIFFKLTPLLCILAFSSLHIELCLVGLLTTDSTSSLDMDYISSVALWQRSVVVAFGQQSMPIFIPCCSFDGKQ